MLDQKKEDAAGPVLRISIVTPSFNQARFLRDCLLSVKDQNHPSVEHIVMDGGSTDESVEILREYSSKPGWSYLRWISERDRGQSDALNKGFRMATGDVIGWLNSDDFYLQGCFGEVAKAFLVHPRTDVLYGDYFWTDAEGKPIQLRREIAFSRFVLSHTHVNYVQSSGAVFLSRRIIDDGYFLNEGYHYAMDYEFFLRLASAGYRFRRAPEVLCGFRWHEQSKTGAQANKQFEEHEKARRENLARAGHLNGLRGSRFGLTLLRYLADVRRWGEKAVRGHYFTQFQPKPLRKCLSDARQGKAFRDREEARSRNPGARHSTTPTRETGMNSRRLQEDSSGVDEVAARASFLKMTRRKWRLVRAAERCLQLVLPLLPVPHAAKDGDTPPKSILVVEYWNLGDLAIMVPFLKNLRAAFPEAKISLLVNESLKTFLEGEGLVDEFIPVRVPWVQHHSRWKKYNPFSRNWISFARTVQAVRKRQFDWAISGRMDVRDNFLLWLSGAARRIGYGVGGGGFLLTDRVEPDLSRPHRADIWLHLLEALRKPANRDLGGIRLTEDELASAQSFLEEKGIPSDAFLIGVHPGARFAVRRWGDERFAEVARRLLEEKEVHVLWFSDPGNPCAAPALERCHTVSLEFRAFLTMLSRCRLLICNDSGPMHLANLLSVPVVAVFGPQRPEWFGPRGARDRVVIRAEFPCRPCFDYCIFDEPYCLRTITPGQVIASVWEAMGEVRVKRPVTMESHVAAAGEGRRSG